MNSPCSTKVTSPTGEAASAIARHEAVELAAFSPLPDVVEVVSGSGRGRVRWRGPTDALRYAYEDDAADPLRLTPALRRLEAAGLLDDAGYAADEDWLRETAFEYYPDPLHRLRQALTGDRIRNRASVLYSLGALLGRRVACGCRRGVGAARPARGHARRARP